MNNINALITKIIASLNELKNNPKLYASGEFEIDVIKETKKLGEMLEKLQKLPVKESSINIENTYKSIVSKALSKYRDK
jgi:hypothetical protein